MAFLIEQTRQRVLRRTSVSLSRSFVMRTWRTSRRALPPFSGLALPRAFGSVPTLITAAALAAASLAAITLHLTEPQAISGVRPPALIAAGGPLTGIGLPQGTALAPAAGGPPLVTALLAADLWQAANAVYQARLLGPAAATAAPTATAASGPTVEQLLQAQIRLTQAQLAYQALTQAASDAQLAAARDAVGAAQAQVLAAQQAVQAASAATATPTPSPAAVPTDADIQNAQNEVSLALAAFQRVEHPYGDDQIAAARTELSTAQQALAAAQAATPAPAQPTATTAPTVTATAAPTPPVPSATPAAVGDASGVAAPAIVYQAPGAAGAVINGAAIAAPAQVAAASATASATPPPSPSPSPTPTPSPTPRPVASPAGRSANDLFLLQQRVSQAQNTLSRMTAPPDPAALQEAADKVATAQGRLSTLQAALAAAQAATPAPEPPPAAATADPATALSPDQQLAQAQAQYAAAQQQLLALTQQPDPATVKAAQDELNAAQQAWQTLLSQADHTVVAQVNADPQNALLRYAASSATANGLDAVPFAWPARGPISSLFGPSHPLGIDIAQSAGLPVTAAASGVVSFSGGDPCCGYGYYVDITHPGGYVTRYGHLLTPSYLKPGDHVRQGQIIGLSGSTGDSTGPHLHFEVRLNGVPLDPLRLLAGALPRPLSP